MFANHISPESKSAPERLGKQKSFINKLIYKSAHRHCLKALVLKLDNNNFICQINVKVAVYLLWPGEVECKLSWQSFQYFASASRASDPCCRVRQDNNSYMTSNISILFRFQFKQRRKVGRIQI